MAMASSLLAVARALQYTMAKQESRPTRKYPTAEAS